jgi:hypothetical protein
MLPGLGAQAALAVVDRQGAALQARYAARRDVAAEVAAFRERAPRIADAEALLKDRRALAFTLEAFQLEGEIGKTAIIRKLLTEDPTAEGSFANRMADPRWRQFAAAFAPRQGQPPLGDAALVESLVARTVTNRYEKAMGEANPGMREALYFRRMAAQVTTVPQLMSDRALMEVARGALGLPESFGLLSFEQQRDLVTRRLDLSQFQDPKAVARMTQRYLANRGPSEPPASPALALLTGGNGTAGLISLVGKRISFSA